MRQIKRIFVHCTAGSLKLTKDDLLQEFKAKGWSKPGYHYVVFPTGKIESLLPESQVSNGVRGFNSTSINVAYVGGVDKKLNPIDNRTDLQKDALWDLLSSLKEKYPDAHIMGHRDIWGKDSKNWKKWCPCFDAELEYELINNPVIEEPVEEKPISEEKPQKPQEPQIEKPISKGNNGIIIAILIAILGGVVYAFRDRIKKYFKDKIKSLFKKKNKKLYKIIILKHEYDKHTSFYIHINNSILYNNIILCIRR